MLTFSTKNRDANGYSAAQSSALKAQKKMEEPLTEEEIKALVSKVSKMQNNYDPMSPRNVNARRKADKEYREEVAQAAARRKDRIRASGVSLLRDTRRLMAILKGRT